MIINTILESVYTKLLLVVMLALMITFAHEIEAFKSVWTLLFVGVLTVVFYMNTAYDNLGILLLMVSLFIVVYNQCMKTIKNN